MKISLRPETQRRVSEKVRNGDFESANYEEEQMSSAEFQDTRAAVEEGQQQADRGETIARDQVS